MNQVCKDVKLREKYIHTNYKKKKKKFHQRRKTGKTKRRRKENNNYSCMRTCL